MKNLFRIFAVLALLSFGAAWAGDQLLGGDITTSTQGIQISDAAGMSVTDPDDGYLCVFDIASGKYKYLESEPGFLLYITWEFDTTAGTYVYDADCYHDANGNGVYEPSEVTHVHQTGTFS